MAWLGGDLSSDLEVFQLHFSGNFVVEVSVAGYTS